MLRELTRAHPDYAITALVRGSADRISDAFPKVRTVVGDLDDVELVEREASQASVVLRMCTKAPGCPVLAFLSASYEREGDWNVG